MDTLAPGSVKAKWYDIWAAAVAVDAMCVRLTRRGGSGMTPGWGLAFTLKRTLRAGLMDEREGETGGRAERINGTLGNGTMELWNLTDGTMLAS